jgi:hypothetical protein
MDTRLDRRQAAAGLRRWVETAHAEPDMDDRRALLHMAEHTSVRRAVGPGW